MMTSRRTRALSFAAVLCLLLSACGSEGPASTSATDTAHPTDTAGATDTADATDTAGAAAKDATVTMADTAFAPASVSVTPGSTITWTNEDTLPHTVSFGDGGPESEVIEPGGTFAATFEEAGSYAYVCTLHPGMAGVVEVTDAAAAAPGSSSGVAPAAAPAGATGATPRAAHVPAPDTDRGATATAGTPAAAPAAPPPGAGIPGVDVALGEWALVPSAAEAPPGSTTFRFRNLGTVAHALRIRTPGSGRDRLEWRSETVGPGESGLLVADLAPGTYEVDCPVEGVHGEHDELGMEMLFTVRDGAAALAPLPGATAAGPAPAAADGAAVDIASFAFAPAELRVPVGTTVTWTNRDPAPHTATGERFDTGTLAQGESAAVTFDTAGTFDYACAIHPAMRGRVVVEA